ncbi:type II toxin-antitoxin system PemK/MazF family toxin [Geitlerinema sp. CS-897]|nr:type II toxin-antitoxin system PemK/MazF family toxin [Geitlerinema sp. CS-897]
MWGKSSAADAFQVRAISRDRLQKYIGQLDEIEMQQIQIALATVLKLEFLNP